MKPSKFSHSATSYWQLQQHNTIEKSDYKKHRQLHTHNMTFHAIHAVNDTARTANESDDNSAVKAVGKTVQHTTNTVQHITQKKYIKKSYAKQFRKKLTEKAGAALQKTVRHTANIMKRTVAMLVKRPDIAVIIISILVLIALFYTITTMGMSMLTGIVAVISGESQTEQIEEPVETYSNAFE